MKVYRVTLNVKLNEVDQSLVTGPGGQAGGFSERVIAVQMTETAGEGQSPREAFKKAMENGMEAYFSGLAEASDRTELLAPPGKGEREGH